MNTANFGDKLGCSGNCQCFTIMTIIALVFLHAIVGKPLLFVDVVLQKSLFPPLTLLMKMVVVVVVMVVEIVGFSVGGPMCD